LVIADLAEARIRDAEQRAEQLACELAVARAKIEGLTPREADSGAVSPELNTGDAVFREASPDDSEVPDNGKAEGIAGEPEKLDAAARRRYANEFWDRVMIEVQSLMLRLSQEGREAFRPAELVVYLPKELLDEALKRGETLTASVLSSRMATRARHRKFFVKESDRAAFTLLEGYQHAG